MSGSIGRSYLIQSWNDAASYSGEQIGQRLKESTDLYLANGKANIGLFEEKPKASAKKKSVLDSILLADRNYTRLCGLSEQLDTELDSGQITDFDAYCAARNNIDQRLTKAWARVQRERGWEGQGELLEPEQYPSKGLELTLDFEAKTQRQYDYSVIPRGSVFAELDNENVFKKIYTNLLTGCKALSKLLNNGKEILKEGLV
jgi:hypothetical protein